MRPIPSGEIRTTTEKQVEVGTWGVFFVWTGITLLAGLGWGLWLLGVGVVILGAQLIRRLLTLPIELFWVVAGALFLIGGVSELALLGVSIALIPALCIVAGAGLLARALSHRRRPHHA